MTRDPSETLCVILYYGTEKRVLCVLEEVEREREDALHPYEYATATVTTSNDDNRSWISMK